MLLANYVQPDFMRYSRPLRPNYKQNKHEYSNEIRRSYAGGGNVFMQPHT